MQIHVEESRKLRRASAIIREDGAIHVKVPRHWPRDLKRSATEELVERLQRKDQREKALLASKKVAQQARITITSQAELEHYVRQINAETFNVPLGKIRLGYARYNHLAQVNLQTKTMTVSKYCLQNAPADALRYLIVHELAHYFESGHGPKFWALVARHVPDYRLQSRIMKAFHHQAVIHSNAIPAMPPEVAATPLAPLSKPGVPTPKSGYTQKPSAARPKPTIPTPVPALQTAGLEQNKTGRGVPGLVKQLLLWLDS
jgi:predicted metal-dependent hydrolase